MKTYALINKVTNICENVSKDERSANEIKLDEYHIVDITGLEVGIGYSYVDGEFYPPPEDIEMPEEQVVL